MLKQLLSWNRRPRRRANVRAGLYEPVARYAHSVAALNGKVYMWGGRCASFDTAKTSLAAQVEIFDHFTEIWSQELSTGEPPPGLYHGSYTTCAGMLYHYGGYDGTRHSSALSSFDPATLKWGLLGKDYRSGPLPKCSCAMVCFGEVLWVFAGFGPLRGPIQPGSTFIDNGHGFGRTNEIHSFHTRKGMWSSPAISGERPSPRAHCTLTAIDDHRAVVFAGRTDEGRVNDTFILDVLKMSFSELVPVEGGRVPVARAAHAACCLNYGSPNPQLLVSGGRDNNITVLSDCWILDVVSRVWQEVDLPHGLQPRAGHSLTAIALGEGLTETLSFKGFSKWPDNLKNAADLDPYLISDTTVMLFESLPSPPSAASPKWTLSDVITNSQRGGEERIMAKKMKLAKLCTTDHLTTGAPQPQATSLSDEPHTSPGETEALQALQEQEQGLEQRAHEAERREQETKRQLHEAQQRARDAERREQQTKRRLHHAQQRAHKAEKQLLENEEVTCQLQELAVTSEQREQEAHKRAQQYETQFHEASGRAQQYETKIQVMQRYSQIKNRQNQQAVQQLEVDNRQSQQRIQQLEVTLERKHQENKALETQWVVQREEIKITQEELGRGGWAAVKVAKFRGTRVAAKCFFQQIVSPYNRRLFQREMNMAARLRHPNLVQFIGTTLQGEMIILTELMPTSLRAVLEQRAIFRDEISSISLDVARALNYLHLMQPEPLIHRDISSANVLLEPLPNNSWKAKVSDYGSVNQLQSLHTTGAGNPTYAAPEASTPDQQSPKMDIFSFGILLIEMCTDEFPDLNNREEHIESITDPRFLSVIMRCLDEAKDKRPTAAQLIEDFQQ